MRHAAAIVGEKAAGFFRPRRMGHVNFWVHGAENVAAFYRDVVGIEEAYRRESIRAIFLSNGNTYHDVAFMDLSSPRGAGRVPGLHHFSFELENEKALVEGFEASKKAGFTFDFTISADVTNSAYGSDPDGNRFEVYADVVEDWRAVRSGAVSSGGKPWTPGAVEPITKALYPVNPELRSTTGAIFKPKRVSHVVLITRDHAAMVDHYLNIVGLKALAGAADGDFVVLGGTVGEETLTLFRARAGEKAGLHHFGVELYSEQELEQSMHLAQAKGIEPAFVSEHPTRRSLYVADPAGNLIQFFVNRKPDLRAWEGETRDTALLLA